MTRKSVLSKGIVPIEFYLMLALFSVFYVLPTIMSCYYTFMQSSVNGNFIGLSNFCSLLKNSYYILALKNSFFYSIIGVTLVCFTSLLLAFFLCEFRSASGVIQSILLIPLLIPTSSIAIIWPSIFTNSIHGTNTVQLILSNWGISFEQQSLLTLFVWKNIGINVIIIVSAIALQPSEIYEAASLDGASRYQKFMKITLPLLTPSVLFLTIYNFSQSLKSFKEAYLLYGNYPDNSIYTVMHFMNNHFQKLNYHMLASSSILFSLIIIPIVIFVYIATKKVGSWN